MNYLLSRYTYPILIEYYEKEKKSNVWVVFKKIDVIGGIAIRFKIKKIGVIGGWPPGGRLGETNKYRNYPAHTII